MTKPTSRTAGTKTRKPAQSRSVLLSPVMRYNDPGQLTVPDHLNLGTDGKLYLTRSSEPDNLKAKPQPISLKESVAWFRIGHDYNLSLTKGERFTDWLKMIEQGLG